MIKSYFILGVASKPPQKTHLPPSAATANQNPWPPSSATANQNPSSSATANQNLFHPSTALPPFRSAPAYHDSTFIYYFRSSSQWASAELLFVSILPKFHGHGFPLPPLSHRLCTSLLICTCLRLCMRVCACVRACVCVDVLLTKCLNGCAVNSDLLRRNVVCGVKPKFIWSCCAPDIVVHACMFTSFVIILFWRHDKLSGGELFQKQPIDHSASSVYLRACVRIGGSDAYAYNGILSLILDNYEFRTMRYRMNVATTPYWFCKTRDFIVVALWPKQLKPLARHGGPFGYVTLHVQCKKVGSYIAQYPILRIGQSALHFTSLTDLFNQTTSLGSIQRH